MATGSAPSFTLLALIAIALVMAWAPTPKSPARSTTTGFLDRTVEVAGGTRRYQVYVPFDWTKDKKWPVILFLHGAGERGTDGLLQTEVGLGPAIRLNATRWPFIVVMPQCDAGSWWTDPRPEALAMQALNETMREFNGDERRVYLTGISMGGYGTWSLASKYPERFAAIAPVCGGVHAPFVTGKSERYADVATKVKTLPVWIFHGEVDPTVPVSESRRMYEALRSIGADVRYTEYKGIGHNSWDAAYAEPELPRWFLSHSRK